MEKYQCLCCGCKTLESRGKFDICPVCFWEDDTYLDFSVSPIVGRYYDKGTIFRGTIRYSISSQPWTDIKSRTTKLPFIWGLHAGYAALCQETI